MVLNLTDVIELLDIQREHAIDYANDCGVYVESDVLWIPNNDKFDIPANRQVSYYDGHTNMVEAILRDTSPRKYLKVHCNKHYLSD